MLSFPKRSIFRPLSAALLFGSLIAFLDIGGLEFSLFDLRFKFNLPKGAIGKVVLVEYDEKTKSALRGESNLSDLGLVAKVITGGSPRKVLIMNRITGSLLQPDLLGLFNEHSKNSNGRIIWALDAAPDANEPKAAELSRLLPHIQFLPLDFSIDILRYGADGVSRRANVYSTDRAQVTAAVGATTDESNWGKLINLRGMFKDGDSYQIFINHRNKKLYPRYSMIDVIEGKVPATAFTGKIVIVGRDAKDWSEDYTKSPLDKRPYEISRVSVVASTIDTILSDDAIVRIDSFYVRYILSILGAFLALIVLFSMKPAKGLLILLGTVMFFVVSAFALFRLFQLWIPMAHPLVAVTITYYFLLPYRLVQESRKSWEYQQKNKLLTEVERLKTNFLSMMSHDLKTPLARIQGMADMALARPDNLSPDQLTALKSIGASTDELTNFVSGILDLGRVESQEVKLHLQARDINSLLEEAILKVEHIAKARNIQIMREFEPLFSIKLDATLMRQVFTNLIENAIKYSPESSKVLVSTEELPGGHIQVQIADQGIGIPSQELPHIFTKFYRSDEVKNGPIKGSGLGLFLAKYFVELHKGRISVESVPQQGSTFTVDLPTN